MKLNKMKNLIKDLEKLTKKQILIFGGVIPLGFLIGMTLNAGFTKIAGGGLEKYNIEKLSISDVLKADTILRKQGEIHIDTLIDYYKLSKKEIKFKSFDKNLKPEGCLYVKNKESSKYKLLRNGIPSKEIIGKNNETKKYYITKNFFDGGFELDKLELMKYGADSNFLDNSFNINSAHQKDTKYEVYTRSTNLGKIVLENEQAEVKKYLNKIVEYKKGLKD